MIRRSRLSANVGVTGRILIAMVVHDIVATINRPANLGRAKLWRIVPPFVAILLGLAFLVLAPRSTGAGGEDPSSSSPDVLLQQRYQLVGLAQGKTWVLQTELSLRKQLEKLPRWKDQLHAQEKHLVHRIYENHRLWRRRKLLEKTLGVGKSESSTPPRLSKDPKKRKMQQQLAVLRKTAFHPDQLCGAPDVKVRLKELTNGRQQLWLTAQWIRGALTDIEKQYARLRKDESVAQALQQMSGARLGPVRSYNRDIQQLRDYENYAFRETLPLYREGANLRVGAILNERTPATFTLSPRDHPVVITANMLEAAGLSIPQDAPQETFTNNQRRIAVRRVTIPYLRFGKCLLRDISACVLPPEGEDMGGRICRGAFEGRHVVVQPEKLTLKIIQRKASTNSVAGARKSFPVNTSSTTSSKQK